jgi:hypothetical protein
MKNETKVSSVIRLTLYTDLLARAIELSRHPASVQEYRYMLDKTLDELKVNVMTAQFDAMNYFNEAICICGAPMLNGICSVQDCVNSEENS